MRVIARPSVKKRALLSLNGRLVFSRDISAPPNTTNKEELKGLISMIQSMAFHLFEHKKGLLNLLKPEIIELSLTICEKVVRQELSAPSALAKLIDTYINAAINETSGEEVKVYLSCEDLVLLEKEIVTYGESRVAFLPDGKLERGDVRIETPSALLSGTIARELEDLRARLLTPAEEAYAFKK